MVSAFPPKTESCCSRGLDRRENLHSVTWLMWHESETSRYEELILVMTAVQQPFTRKILLSPYPFSEWQNGQLKLLPFLLLFFVVNGGMTSKRLNRNYQVHFT